ncbi:hypothetical protein BDB01DRAFT_852632 [Pilobolus umbonatus]|nr:hypothetical protein BDB01DRAFT_852632 [Pilobolus umbonatus]
MSRLLDGLSQSLTRPLKDMTVDELTQLKERTSHMLYSTSVKLPDGGNKLRMKIREIEKVIAEKEGMTQRMKNISLVDFKRPNVREETIQLSNQLVDEGMKPHNLLKAANKSTSGARMMSLEESVQLQAKQQREIKEANVRKRMESMSLKDDLSLTLEQLNLETCSNGEPNEEPSDDSTEEEEDIQNDLSSEEEEEE